MIDKTNRLEQELTWTELTSELTGVDIPLTVDNHPEAANSTADLASRDNPDVIGTTDVTDKEPLADILMQTDNHPQDATAEQDENSKFFESWLLSLEPRGGMLQYLEPLVREFTDAHQLTASLVPSGEGASVIAAVDPVIFEVLGVRSLGHRLMLAKGIVALAARLADEASHRSVTDL